jgi:nucleoside-diphosphate-sugar epimerase
MRALVTGCAGFIGSHLTESLLADGVEVVGVDCFNDNYGRAQKLRNLDQFLRLEGFEFAPIDLARGDLVDLVAECDVIYHLAAEPGVRNSWGSRFELYVRNNMLATQHLLEATAQHPVKRFVYASSASVYGETGGAPAVEDTQPAPISPYGVTKLGGEHLCNAYRLNAGVETVTLRYFSVFGPRQRPDMAFNLFCRSALAGEPVTVLGDGRQTRDFTYIDDVVTCTRTAATNDEAVGRVYNVGGGLHVSILEAIATIERLVGRTLGIHHVPGEPGDVRATAADTTRMESELGIRPTTTLDEGLHAELEWMAGERVGAA